MAHGCDRSGSVDRRQTLVLVGAIAASAACSDDSVDPAKGGSNAGGSDNPGGSPPSTDGIFDASLIVESAQQADGALMAWKVLVLGSAAAAPGCG